MSSVELHRTDSRRNILHLKESLNSTLIKSIHKYHIGIVQVYMTSHIPDFWHEASLVCWRLQKAGRAEADQADKKKWQIYYSDIVNKYRGMHDRCFPHYFKIVHFYQMSIQKVYKSVQSINGSCVVPCYLVNVTKFDCVGRFLITIAVLRKMLQESCCQDKIHVRI